MDGPIYYLSSDEIKHYNYVIKHGYNCETVNLESQQYIVFETVDRQDIGIAWPSINGKIMQMNDSLDTLFEQYGPLQRLIMPNLRNDSIKTLLFPKYAG